MKREDLEYCAAAISLGMVFYDTLRERLDSTDLRSHVRKRIGEFIEAHFNQAKTST